MRRRRLAAWAGALGPLLFVVTFTVEGWLRPDYDAKTTFISALSLGPRGWIQVLNFGVLGLVFLAFALGVAAEFPEGKSSRAGPILLALIGAAFFASGPLVMDPMDTVREHLTWHGILHGLFGALVFTLAPISCFIFLRRFREDPRWRSLGGWTAVAGVVMVGALVLLRIAAPRPPAPANVLTPWAGAIQRVLVVTFLSWIFTFALWLRRPRP